MKNPKLFFLALLGLAFALLGFFVNWIFFLFAIIIMIINQREIMGKMKNS